jgi:hypothetical protein
MEEKCGNVGENERDSQTDKAAISTAANQQLQHGKSSGMLCSDHEGGAAAVCLLQVDVAPRDEAQNLIPSASQAGSEASSGNHLPALGAVCRGLKEADGIRRSVLFGGFDAARGSYFLVGNSCIVRMVGGARGEIHAAAKGECKRVRVSTGLWG